MGAARYVIRGGVEGRARLRLLSEVMGPSTRALLAETGIPAGSACLDVGCGGGDVAFDLARATGPAGRVLGVDIDETKLGLARRAAAQQNLSNVGFETRDVTEWEPVEQFDVVYARFLLTHLSEPAAFVSAMGRHLQPGGVMIVEDIDYRGHFSEPDCPALRRSVELYTQAAKNRGAGLDEVRMRVIQPAALQGGIKLLVCVTLENIADAVLKDGLATEAELRSTIEALYAFARDPDTVLGGPRVFQVWGRGK